MKQQLVLALCGTMRVAGALDVRAESVRSDTTTEKTTTYKGTVSEFAPGSSTIMLKTDTGGPTRYQVSEKTTFVDMDGNVVSRETISKDQPVTIYTTPEAGSTIVSKVVVDRSGGGSTVRKERTVEERRTE